MLILDQEVTIDEKSDLLVSKTPEKKIPSQSAISLNKENKDGEKLTVKEKIETGKVKLSVLKEYFRVCRLPRLLTFMILFCLSNIASVSTNVFLSYWTNNAEKVDKYFYFSVFTSIGITQCNY